ncbi:FeoB small GTPase domain-containing protein [Haloimpatiens sp. FM7330]|uniref:FeoB small GTPase domain-containing protein n=1 Tax=Haloimpatiens sp. FM7330 TaxID=3298610 RepID=UPI0036286C60
MGITYSSSLKKNLKDSFDVKKETKDDFIIALAGNPNTGKSTVFNSLTGLHQHTGNWPGKTVTSAQGKYIYNNHNFIVVDLPGTYSLMASSVEEEVARDFLCFSNLNATVVVVDATCLERNLNLVLQVLEITDKVIVCLNLMDEAKNKNIQINIDLLSHKLGIPVIPTNARNNIGILNLKDTIYKLCKNKIITNPIKIKYGISIEKFLSKTTPKLDEIFKGKINSRWIALRLLDGDKSILDSISKYLDVQIPYSNLKEGINHE